MDQRPVIQFNKIFRYIITTLVIAGVIFLLWYLKMVTIFILVGLGLSLIGRPVFRLLGKIKIGRFQLPASVKAILSIVILWGVIAGFFALLIPILIREGNRLSNVNPEKITEQLREPVGNAIVFLEKYGLVNFKDTVEDTGPQKIVEIHERTILVIPYPDTLDASGNPIPFRVDTLEKKIVNDPSVTMNDSLTRQKTDEVLRVERIEKLLKGFLIRVFDLTQVQKIFSSVLGTLANLLAIIASATFIAFFLLKDESLGQRIVLGVVPKKYEKQVMIIMHDSNEMLSRYFLGVCAELFLVMVCTAIGLLIIGFNIQTAIVIGFFCGFFNIIPYAGPLIGGTLGILLGITHQIDAMQFSELYPLVLKMGLVFWLVQVLDNNIFQTVIFGKSVNAHPLEIFMVIVIAGYVAGIPGMILAVPTYSFLRIVAKQFFRNFKVVRSLTDNI